MVGAGLLYPWDVPEPLVDPSFVGHVLEIAWRRDSHLHGEAHWHAVTATGLDLAERDAVVDAELVFLFGLLQDTRRQSDGRDGGHGPRASTLARELHADGLLLLEQERLA